LRGHCASSRDVDARGGVPQSLHEAVDVALGDVQVRGDPQGAAAEGGVAVGPRSLPVVPGRVR